MVSSTVKAYAAIQNSYSDTPYQLHKLRLIRPDDSGGQKLLLCLPSTVVHELDVWSPLTPPIKAGDNDTFSEVAASAYKWPSSRQRLDDCSNNKGCGFFCIACGKSILAESALRRHTSMTAAIELQDSKRKGVALCLVCGVDVPWRELTTHYTTAHPTARAEQLVNGEHWVTGLSHSHANVYDCFGNRHDGYEHVQPNKCSREQVIEWMRRSQPEVIGILNAVDAATGREFEIQQSYTLDDIVWDAQHKPCVYPDQDSSVATVDFEAFLETIDAPPIPEGGLADDIQFHL